MSSPPPSIQLNTVTGVNPSPNEVQLYELPDDAPMVPTRAYLDPPVPRTTIPTPDAPRRHVSSSSRKELTLPEKMQLIHQASKGHMTNTKLAKKFGISNPTVGRILKRKREYIELAIGATDGAQELNLNTRKRKVRHARSSEVNDLVYRWYTEQRTKTHPTGLQLRAHALACAKDLDVSTSFRASKGWLAAFRTRYEIPASVSVRKDLDENHMAHVVLREAAPTCCPRTAFLEEAEVPPSEPRLMMSSVVSELRVQVQTLSRRLESRDQMVSKLRHRIQELEQERLKTARRKIHEF